MRLIILITIIFEILGCTDIDRASFFALGNPGHIECYSGTLKIFEGMSTGVIQTVAHSDGWEFKDQATGKFIRVSGACVIWQHINIRHSFGICSRS